MVALGAIIDVVGRVRPNRYTDCNHHFATRGPAGMTALYANCTSNCPQLLDYNGNIIRVRNGTYPMLKQIYVSRVVISIASIPRIHRSSRTVL